MASPLPDKILALLLAVVFLVVSVGNSFGYAWCFDEAGALRLELASAGGCADRRGGCQAPLRSAEVESLSGREEVRSQACFDLLRGQDEALFPKRSVKGARFPLFAGNLPRGDFNSSLQWRHYARKLPPLRVSQALIGQRTVVLLI